MLALILAVSLQAQVNPPSVPEPPPAVPRATLSVGQWNISAPVQQKDGDVYTLHGSPAEVESATLVFRADDIVFNQETGDWRLMATSLDDFLK